jgi:hypothetical protein
VFSRAQCLLQAFDIVLMGRFRGEYIPYDYGAEVIT